MFQIGKHTSTLPTGEPVYRSERPADMDEQLKIRQRKDGAIAHAMSKGATFDEIMAIENAPDEKFRDKEGQIIPFPDQSERKKERGA